MDHPLSQNPAPSSSRRSKTDRSRLPESDDVDSADRTALEFGLAAGTALLTNMTNSDSCHDWTGEALFRTRHLSLNCALFRNVRATLGSAGSVNCRFTQLCRCYLNRASFSRFLFVIRYRPSMLQRPTRCDLSCSGA